MKKLTLSLVSILAMSGLSYGGGDIDPVPVPVAPVAATSAWFIGVMGGYENASSDTTILNTSCNAEFYGNSDQDYGLFGVKVGYMFDFNNRVDLSFETSNNDRGFLRVPISLNYTYVTDYEIANIHPLIGVGFGWVDWKDTVLCQGVGTDVDMDGTMWQVRIGGLYELNEDWEAEVYYRYSQVSLDAEDFQGNGYTGNINVDNIDRNGVFLGINYKF